MCSLNQLIHSVQWHTANKAFNDSSGLLVRSEGESSWSTKAGYCWSSSKSNITLYSCLTFESIFCCFCCFANCCLCLMRQGETVFCPFQSKRLCLLLAPLLLWLPVPTLYIRHFSREKIDQGVSKVEVNFICSITAETLLVKMSFSQVRS